jgi:anti-sigma28 factor (negative regulator of flagellin synthesis)
MSDISQIGPALAPRIDAPEQRTTPATRRATPLPTRARGDEVTLSATARDAAVVNETPIRVDLVNRIGQEIASGAYDVDAKLDEAIPGLLKDLRELP